MMISGNVDYKMLSTLNKCTCWEDLEKTNYTKYLDETFSEYMKSLYKKIDNFKNKIFKFEECLEDRSIESTNINKIKLIELKKCRGWDDMMETGYAQHIDQTFKRYLLGLFHSVRKTEKKELFFMEAIKLGRAKNPTDSIEELSVEKLVEYTEEEVVEYRRKTGVDNWPIKITQSILQFLPPKDLCKTSGVNKHWYKVTWHNELWKNYDLKKLYPKLNIIGQKDWEKHVDLKNLGLTFKGNPGVHKRNLLPVLKELFALNTEGVTLITLPEGLREEKIFEIGKLYVDREIHTPVDETIMKTKIIAVTNSVIPKSKQKTTDGIPMEFEWPDHLSTLANIILTNVSSEGKKYLYVHKSETLKNNVYSGLTWTEHVKHHCYLGFKHDFFSNKQDKVEFVIKDRFDRNNDRVFDFGVGVTKEIKPDVFDKVSMEIDKD